MFSIYQQYKKRPYWRYRNIIHQQYDEMVKYVAALRLNVVDTESILKQFSKTLLILRKALQGFKKALRNIFLYEHPVTSK